MITAFILMRVDYARLNEIAAEIAKSAPVAEVYAVAGDEDLIVVVRGDSNEEIAEVVTRKIAKLDGVNSCRTKIALRAYKTPA